MVRAGAVAPRVDPSPLGLAASVALLAGVVAVQRFPSIPPPATIFAIALVGAVLWCRRGAARPLGAALAGIALACLQAHGALAERLPGPLAGRELVVDLRVTGLPVADGNGVQFDARIERGAGDASVLAGRRVRLGWIAHPPEPVPRLSSGSRWRVAVRLREPRGLVNPGGTDFERRAAEQGLAATGYVVGPGARRLPERLGGVRDRIDAVRERLSTRIADALSPERARFVSALAIGDTRALSDDDWAVLRATGLTHLIAISGFHVGIVAGFGALLGRGLWRIAPRLGRRWPRPQGAAAIALAFAFAYTALAGFALPTVRTLLMIAAALAARLACRAPRASDAFALALVGVLAVAPASVLTPGFWLSFAGVAWLLWCLPPGAVGGSRTVVPFLQAQAVATLGLLPLTVWFFGQASLAGPVANLVGIPWISLAVVPLCLLGIVAAPVSDVAAGTLWGMAAILMETLWRGLEPVAASPASLAWLPEPSIAALVAAALGVAWCLMPRGAAARPLGLCLLLPLVFPATDRPRPGEVDLWLLDTGQGVAMLVRTATRDQLYDAGPATPGGADLGATTVVPALRALGVSRLDTLIVSHGDADHAGGAPAVREAFPPDREFAPEGWVRAPGVPCIAGRYWVRDGVRFTVLHPPRFFPYQRNESSCVLRIDAVGASALLAGDIGRHVEARLAKSPPSAIRTDVLLVPHHGSASSSSLEFLHATRPRLALIGVGRDNRFGLPEPVVLGRYDRYRVPVLTTADSGAIRVRLAADGARVAERLRQDRRRWWRDAPPVPAGYADADSGTRR